MLPVLLCLKLPVIKVLVPQRSNLSLWLEGAVTFALLMECVKLNFYNSSAMQNFGIVHQTAVLLYRNSGFYFFFISLFMLIIPVIILVFHLVLDRRRQHCADWWFLVAPHFTKPPWRRSLLSSLFFLFIPGKQSPVFHVTDRCLNPTSLPPRILLMNLAISHLSDADYNLLIPCCRCRVMRLFFGPGVHHRMWGYIRDEEVRDDYLMVTWSTPLALYESQLKYF